MNLFLRPNDVVMFRDGRPFAGGENHYARGVFPPPPSTFYGALRSKILSEHFPDFKRYKEGVDIPKPVKEVVGTGGDYGTLRIDGFFIGKENDGDTVEPFFILPFDVVKEKEDGGYICLKPDPSLWEKTGIRVSLPDNGTFLKPLWCRTGRHVEYKRVFIGVRALERYLLGGVPEVSSSDEVDIYMKDERVGIKKNRRRGSVVSGALYSVEYWRLRESFGFIIQVDGDGGLLPGEGLIRIGGDHRSCHYRRVEPRLPEREKVMECVRGSGYFKLILLTPACFTGGWLPDFVDDEGIGERNDVRFRLVSVVIGRYDNIGGFDLLRGRPKAIKRYVPAGSVYFFKLEDGDVEALFDAFWFKSISTERAEEGFGITIIGGY